MSAFYLSGCVVLHLIISTNINEFLLYSTHFEGQCFDIFDIWCKKKLYLGLLRTNSNNFAKHFRFCEDCMSAYSELRPGLSAPDTRSNEILEICSTPHTVDMNNFDFLR